MQARKITECSCSICKSLCERVPCTPTPGDVERLIAAGYKDKLMFTMWPDVKAENMPLPHIAPEFVKWHGCIFHTKDKLCELHESGLKPLEGKLAIHDMEDGGLKRTIVYNWISERGANVMEQFNPDAAKLIREMIPYVNNRTILD